MMTSAFMFDYFYAIRTYSMLLMFGAMHVCFFWHLVKRRSSDWTMWSIFLFTASILLYTHVFSAVLLAALGGYCMLFAPRSRKSAGIISVWILAAITFLPYLPVVAKGVSHIRSKFATVALTSSGFGVLENLGILLSNGMPPLLIVMCILISVRLWRIRSLAMIHWTLFTLNLLMAFVAIDFQFGFLLPIRSRYLPLFWIPFTVLCAYGISAGSPWHRVGFICLLIYSVAGFQFYRSNTIAGFRSGLWGRETEIYPPVQDYIFHLRDAVGPKDFVVGFAVSDHFTSIRKHGKSIADFYLQAQLKIDGAFVSSELNGSELHEDFHQRVGKPPFLLFAYEPHDMPDNFHEVYELILQDYAECELVVNTEQFFVQRYVYRSLECDREYQPIHYENGITIVDYVADYNPSTDTIRVVTGWDVADQDLLQLYNVSFQILTDDWQNVVQAPDKHLYNDVLKWYVVELTTADLPPGDYRAVVIVYDRYRSSAKVTGVISASGETGTILPVLHFTVED